MPDINTHCEISLKRTGKDYRKLHEWIDEPKKFLGVNHRIERHSFNEAYKEFIKKEFGERAIVEWLFHIVIDNLETANKYAIEVYNKAYGSVSIDFKGKEIIGCKFIKKYANSSNQTYFKKSLNKRVD